MLNECPNCGYQPCSKARCDDNATTDGLCETHFAMKAAKDSVDAVVERTYRSIGTNA